MANLQGCFRKPGGPALSGHAAQRRSTGCLRIDPAGRIRHPVLRSVRRPGAPGCATVNCGHLPPILARAAGGIQRLTGTRLCWGLPGLVLHGSGHRSLPGRHAGAVLGWLTEAGIEAGEEFGKTGLIAMIEAGRTPRWEPPWIPICRGGAELQFRWPDRRHHRGGHPRRVSRPALRRKKNVFQ